MPVVLPADAVGEVCGDRLVGEQVLHRHRGGTRHEQDQRHADQHGSMFGEQRSRLCAGHERDDPSDEDRDHRVHDGDDESGDEQGREQRLRLSGKMPIERHQPRRRLRGLGRDSRLQQPFEQREHGEHCGRSARLLGDQSAFVT